MLYKEILLLYKEILLMRRGNYMTGGSEAVSVLRQRVARHLRRLGYGAAGAAALVAALSVPLLTYAQASPREIRSEPICAACSIQFRRIATLGDNAGPGQLGGAPQSVARDSGGRFWVSVYRVGEAVKVFSAAGKFERNIGGVGKGPQEFTGPLLVQRSSLDSIYLFDLGNARLSVYSAGAQFTRSQPIPSTIDRVAVGGDGIVVANASLPTRSAVGLPLHVLDAFSGAFARSFGAQTPIFRDDLPRVMSRIVAFADRDHVWSILPTRYVIERWNIRNGTLSESMVRKAPWFEPHWLPEVVPPSPGQPPQPYITGAAQDPLGRIWVYLLVADSEWKKALGPVQRRGNRDIYPVVDIDKYYDTLVEVIDISTKRLVATGRFDAALPIVIDFSRVAALDARALDVSYRVSVWDVSLVNPRH